MTAAAAAAASQTATNQNPGSFYGPLLNATQNVPVAATPNDPNTILASNTTPVILSYPFDLPKYYMALFIQNYNRPTIQSPLQLKGTQMICLPLPPGLIDSQTVAYNQAENNALVGAAAGAAASGMAPGALQGLLTGVAAASTVGAANEIVSQSGSTVAQFAGIALNPFLTVQLQSPTFKHHSFQWQFSPDSAQESVRLQLILNTLKYNQLPAIWGGSGSVFWQYPNIFKPVIIPATAETYQFKFCVLENMTVNYAAGGVPSFYAGTQAPTQISVVLNFLEIEIWTQNNYSSAYSGQFTTMGGV